MIKRIAGTPARVTSVACLLTIVTGTLAIAVRDRLVVSGDAAATATNILGHAMLFQLGVAAGLIAVSSYVAVTLLLYHTFKHLGGGLSLFAAFVGLCGCATGALSCFFHLAALVVLRVAQYLSVFDVERLRALALMLLNLRAQATQGGLVLVVLYCLLIAYLTFRLTCLPRLVNVQRWKGQAHPDLGHAAKGRRQVRHGGSSFRAA